MSYRGKRSVIRLPPSPSPPSLPPSPLLPSPPLSPFLFPLSSSPLLSLPPSLSLSPLFPLSSPPSLSLSPSPRLPPPPLPSPRLSLPPSLWSGLAGATAWRSWTIARFCSRQPKRRVLEVLSRVPGARASLLLSAAPGLRGGGAGVGLAHSQPPALTLCGTRVDSRFF